MPQYVKWIIKNLPKPDDARIIPSLALLSLTSKSGKGVYASSDTLYKSAVFGRDSLEVAEDLLLIRPKLVYKILMTLAQLQGLRYDDISEEAPGKIIHEYRSVVVDGKPIDQTSMEIFKALTSKWGGTDTDMHYYGSVDATPLFLRVLNMYVGAFGDKILSKHVTRRDGKKVTMRQVAADATQWLVRTVQTSRSGLVEFVQTNPRGILNKAWKDSDEFYRHEDKQDVNHNAPIASIEVQAIAYDALMAAATFQPQQAKTCVRLARALRDRTIELLWQEDRASFALGLDFDPSGAMRIIRTNTANPATMLDSGFFDDLPSKARQKYITAIVTQVMGADYLTDAGIRSRSLRAADLVSFWDYHGSFVTWPKETYDVAKGLRRQGFTKLSHQLENRILNIVLKSRQYPEFVYVDGQGRVLISPPRAHTYGDLIIIDSTNKPEYIQAWTVSAVMGIIYRRLSRVVKIAKPPAQTDWQLALESKLMSRMHKVRTYINPFALSARYPTYQYEVKKQR